MIFWKINQNISKIFPLLKIFGNKNGIFRAKILEIWPKDEFFSWVFRIWARWLREVEVFPWVLVFSAVDVRKKPVLSNCKICDLNKNGSCGAMVSIFMGQHFNLGMTIIRQNTDVIQIPRICVSVLPHAIFLRSCCSWSIYSFGWQPRMAQGVLAAAASWLRSPWPKRAGRGSLSGSSSRTSRQSGRTKKKRWPKWPVLRVRDTLRSIYFINSSINQNSKDSFL